MTDIPTSFDDPTGLIPMDDAARNAALHAMAASNLLQSDTRLVIGVSGGRDSLCLLDMVAQLVDVHNILAVHVHHGLRGETAERDMQVASDACAARGIRCEVVRLLVPQDRRKATYEWARLERRAALRRHADDFGGPQTPVLLAHSTTDQAETVLMRLMTRPGGSALGGMLHVDEELNIWRPLLWTEMSRQDCTRYCMGAGIEWEDDPLNACSMRGRVRDVLFQMAEIDGRTEGAMIETARRLREDEDGWQMLAQAEVDRCNGELMSFEHLRSLPTALARRVIRLYASYAVGYDCPKISTRLDEVLNLGRGAQLDVGNRITAVNRRGNLFIQHTPPRQFR